MEKKYSELEQELIKISPALLYDIASDIQVSKKWKQFAWSIGFTTENVTIMAETNSDRFPAENVIYHWFSRNPKIKDLVIHLLDLNLEKPLFRLYEKGYLKLSWKGILNKIKQKRQECELENIPYVESIHNISQISNKPTSIEPNVNNNSNDNTVVPVINVDNNNNSNNITANPEAGLIDIDTHMPSIPRSINNFKRACSMNNCFESEDFIETCPCLSNSLSLLELRSLRFDPAEFLEDDDVKEALSVAFKDEDDDDGPFVIKFSKLLRFINFEIHAYSIKNITQTVKFQKQLYNIIWAETTFRFHTLPILSGYCIYDNAFLFLIYPDSKSSSSLFDLLHRALPNSVSGSDDYQISADERLTILTCVGRALTYMHNMLPFSACHGQLHSYNISVCERGIVLGGFNKFYTENPNYLMGLNGIITDGKTKPISIENQYKKDIKQFVELICEVWFNIQPLHAEDDGRIDKSLVDLLRKGNTKPRIEYRGWTEHMNKSICDIIFKADDKHINVVEIVEDLQSIRELEPVTSMPPSYDEVSRMNFTDKVVTEN